MAMCQCLSACSAGQTQTYAGGGGGAALFCGAARQAALAAAGGMGIPPSKQHQNTLRDFYLAAKRTSANVKVLINSGREKRHKTERM